MMVQKSAIFLRAGIVILALFGLYPVSAEELGFPKLLNAELDQWSGDRLAQWVYVPFSALQVQKSQELYEGKAVVDVFHPKLGFLEQEYLPGSALRPGDMLTVSAMIKSEEKVDASLSFLLLYGKGDSQKRIFKKAPYKGEGEWEKVQVTWIVSAADLKELSKVVVHFSMAKAEKAVQLSSFKLSLVNPGFARTPATAKSIEVACARP